MASNPLRSAGLPVAARGGRGSRGQPAAGARAGPSQPTDGNSNEGMDGVRELVMGLSEVRER